MEHNWVFSADQMEDMTAVPGLISSICVCWTLNFLSNLFMINSLILLKIVKLLLGIEDSEWNGSIDPSNSIGCSNGDHDLARTVLEVCS